MAVEAHRQGQFQDSSLALLQFSGGKHEALLSDLVEEIHACPFPEKAADIRI